jgi:hypothetical protein
MKWQGNVFFSCHFCLYGEYRVKRRTLVGVKGQTAPALGEPSENTFFTE